MKRLIFAGCLSLALACLTASGQPTTGYTNSGTILSAPVVYATNFVNLGLFDFLVDGISSGPFDFGDVRTYTNRNVMYCDLGFNFDLSPATSQDPPEGPAAGFANQNPGQIYGGALSPFTNSVEILLAEESGTAPQILINATNIQNSGLLDVGEAGLISATGNTLDLSRGTLNVEGFSLLSSGLLSSGTALGPGVFDDYWGIGNQSNAFTAANIGNISLPLPITPPHNITSSSGVTTKGYEFEIENASAVALTNQISASNIVVQIILYGDSLGEVTPVAFFDQTANDFADEVVEWSSTVTNYLGQPVNDTLYLVDDLGSLTALTEQTNNTTSGGRNLLVPTNYTLLPTFAQQGTLSTGNIPYSANLFAQAFSTNKSKGSTNQYAALEATVADVTAQPDPTLPGSTFSNVPGRVFISASQSLNLAETTINAGNYMTLSSTNHYMGSQGAAILFPYADISLGSSNGQMAITNLVAPYVPRFSGPIECYSAIWTNLTSATNFVTGTNGTTTNVFTVTNRFELLMVSSSLQATTPVYIGNLSLRSTNLVVSDLLNVTNSMVINAQSLTITSNAPGSVTPEGELNLTALGYLYSSSLPNLLYFTNSGLVETANAAFFQYRQNPFNPTAGDGPWKSIVNHGEIFSVGGDIFWATYFENTGSLLGLGGLGGSGSLAYVESEIGPVTVESSTAVLGNSYLIAEDGDFSLTSGSVTVSNETIEALGLLTDSAGSFTLSVTNLLTDDSDPTLLTDGGSGNFWTAGDGFNLLVAPATSGDLLGTSITSSNLPNVQCENIWAGVKETNISMASGVYTNLLPVMVSNVPLGQLILSGGSTNSVFHFKGPDATNSYALYVDQLVLENGATNLGLEGRANVFTAFNIDSNVTIYYLDAVISNLDISEGLNGEFGGRLVWLSNYVGRFSYTNISFPDGRTFAFNRALRESSDIDSNPTNGGIPNSFTASPFPEPPLTLTPESIGLLISLTNSGPTPKAEVSWLAPAYSTNTLYTKSIAGGSWQALTNFVQGAVNSRVTVYDPAVSNRLYKVGIVPFQ